MTVPYSHIALWEISLILAGVNKELYGTVMGDEAATKDPVSKTGRDERRAAILQIAHDAFLAEGYAATSMSAIAARVGGSKATLYNYFPSKEDLFRAVVRERSDQIAGLLDQGRLQGGGDFRTVLNKFGEGFLAMVLSDEFVKTYRVMMGEAARFPELGHAFYEAGPKQAMHRVGEYFVTAIEAGELKREQPDLMAQYFLDLCLSGLQFRRLWNVTPAPTEEDIRANVARAVSIFLAAFGA